MKKLILTILALSFSTALLNANVLYFYGKVDTVSAANPLIKAGDSAAFTITYNSVNFVISLVYVNINNSELQLVRGAEIPASHVFIDSDPSDGTVQWSVMDSAFFSADVASNTPGGVTPCIDNFDLGRTFSIFFNGIIANGTITSTPRSRNGN